MKIPQWLKAIGGEKNSSDTFSNFMAGNFSLTSLNESLGDFATKVGKKYPIKKEISQVLEDTLCGIPSGLERLDT